MRHLIRQPLFLVLFISLALWGGLTLFTYFSIGSLFGARIDFTPRLVGTTAFWAGESPYSMVVTQRIQQTMFGETLYEGEDEQRFAHPAYSAVLLAPSVLVPQEVALASWQALQLLMLFATPLLWFNILGWRPNLWLTALILISLLVVFRYTMIVYVLGQFTGSILFGFSLAVWCLRNGRQGWAGAALVLCMMPPTFGAFLVGLALMPEVLGRRWRSVAVFIGLMTLLCLISFARIGWWLPDWIDNLRAYSQYANPYFPLGLLPLPLQIVLSFGVLAIFATMTRIWLRERSNESWQDFIGAGLLALALLLPQTGSYYLVSLMVVAVITAMRISRRTQRRLPLMLLWIAFIASPWLWYLLPDRLRTEALFVPLAAALVWWLSRRSPTQSAGTKAA
jgi:hypothetical protein